MIPFYKPTLKRKDMDCVLQTMVDEKIGPGERSKLFMQAFSAKTSGYYSYSFRTYPDCIYLALQVAGAHEGTLVAVSALAPKEYLKAIEKLGSKAVILDVDMQNGCPKEEDVANCGAEILILDESFGTIPVLFDLEEESTVRKADYSSVKVIEDITRSVGGSVDNLASPGSWSDIIICAFEEDCPISSGGGAALSIKAPVAKTEEVQNLLKETDMTYLSLPDLNSALGIVQLTNLDENINRKREILKLYKLALAKTKHKQWGLSILDFLSPASGFAVVLDSKPDEVLKFAKKYDVPIKMAFEQSIIATIEGEIFEKYPNSAVCYTRGVTFPLYPFLKVSETDMIAKVIAHLP